MWNALLKQYPNFEVLMHHQYFHGDCPVAVDLYDLGISYLDHGWLQAAWVSSLTPLHIKNHNGICAEAIRQISWWLKQNEYNHRVYYNKATVFLHADQLDSALKFLTGVQCLMNPGAIKIRAVDDSVSIGEKKVSDKFKKYQYQAILRSGWYTLAETKHWMHLAETMSSDLYLTLGLKRKFSKCIKMNHSGCSVSTFYVFLQDQTTLSYLWLNFPAAIKKTFKLV